MEDYKEASPRAEAAPPAPLLEESGEIQATTKIFLPILKKEIVNTTAVFLILRKMG